MPSTPGLRAAPKPPGCSIAISEAMVRWASKRQRTDDPTEQILNVDVPKKNPPRQPAISQHDELRAVWLACDELGWPYRPGVASC